MSVHFTCQSELRFHPLLEFKMRILKRDGTFVVEAETSTEQDFLDELCKNRCSVELKTQASSQANHSPSLDQTQSMEQLV